MDVNTQSFNRQTASTKYDDPNPNYGPLSATLTPTPVALNNDQLNQALFCVTTAVTCRFEENAAYTQQIGRNLLGFITTETNNLQTRIDQIEREIRPHDHHENLTRNVAYIDSRLTTFTKSIEDDRSHSLREAHPQRQRPQSRLPRQTICPPTKTTRQHLRACHQQRTHRQSSPPVLQFRFDLVDSKLNLNSSRIDDRWETVHAHNYTESDRINDLWKRVFGLERDNIDLRQDNINLCSQVEALQNNPSSTPLENLLVDIYGLPDDVDLACLMVPSTASTRSTIKKKVPIKSALSSAHYFLPLNMIYKLDSDILILNEG
ncbi:hypothetical protein BDK51DRAFT_38575, partial [Blyttiomyces helicus]